jgi:hypothetical protein
VVAGSAVWQHILMSPLISFRVCDSAFWRARSRKKVDEAVMRMSVAIIKFSFSLKSLKHDVPNVHETWIATDIRRNYKSIEVVRSLRRVRLTPVAGFPASRNDDPGYDGRDEPEQHNRDQRRDIEPPPAQFPSARSENKLRPAGLLGGHTTGSSSSSGHMLRSQRPTRRRKPGQNISEVRGKRGHTKGMLMIWYHSRLRAIVPAGSRMNRMLLIQVIAL